MMLSFLLPHTSASHFTFIFFINEIDSENILPIKHVKISNFVLMVKMLQVNGEINV